MITPNLVASVTILASTFTSKNIALSTTIKKMRVFKTRTFERWCQRAGITDAALVNAVVNMESGLIDAQLGGNLFKQRVALPGRGKSGSTRTLIATRFADLLFFLYGFEKNERENISSKELLLYQRFASELLGLTPAQISTALAAKTLTELHL